jgi:hypothetical protein
VSRLALAVVWLVTGGLTLGLLTLAFELSRRPPPPKPEPLIGSMSRQAAAPWARWTVTEQLAAHHVLIAHVETKYLDEAMSITRQIVDPVRTRYTEVLVYIHRPGRPDTLPPRRIQWTRAGGYVELRYE